MTLAIPALSQVLSGRSPIVGTPGEAESAARVLWGIWNDLDAGISRSNFSLLHLRVLRAESVAVIVSDIEGRTRPGAEALADDLRAASKAFDIYGDLTARLHASAMDVEQAVETHLARIRGSAEELEALLPDLPPGTRDVLPAQWEVRPPLWPPLERREGSVVLEDGRRAAAAALGWRHHAAAWCRALDDISECRLRWSALIEERRAAEEGLVAELRRTNLGTLISRPVPPARAVVTRTFTGGSVHPTRFHADPRWAELVGGRLRVSEIPALWRELGLGERDVAGLPIASAYALAQTDGIPFSVRALASRRVLDYARDQPRDAYLLLGLSGSVSFRAFAEQLDEVQQAHQDAIWRARALPGRPLVELFLLGTHDGRFAVAMAIGDLDTATNIGVNIAGMGSDAGTLGDGFGAAEQLYREALTSDPSIRPAVVSWIGYRSPAMPPSVEVVGNDRAHAGAVQLARYLDGLSAARLAAREPVRELAVFGHSYGSATAGESLKLTETTVDAFVSYGSAGLVPETLRSELRAESVYATDAKGDNVAGIGIGLSGRLDPRRLEGVAVFPSEAASGAARTTSHAMYTEAGKRSVWNWGGTVGYLSAGTSAARSMGRILAGGHP